MVAPSHEVKFILAGMLLAAQVIAIGGEAVLIYAFRDKIFRRFS